MLTLLARAITTPWQRVVVAVVIAGAVAAVVLWSLATTAGDAALTSAAVTIVHAYLAVISIVLGVIDGRTHRLPNRIVLPAYPVLLALYALACVPNPDWSPFLRAALAGAAVFGFYLLLHGVRSAGLGAGDVKLAGVTGLALGWGGWDSVLVGVVAAFVVGAALALALMAARRADRHTRIPFGPAMLAGMWIGLIAASGGVLDGA
ncbi:prepilin peptidase [Microbacterium sp.]|uniref:prepilin peptidase n=1 Tax=Microbacterium sp. TaxID=51671 RepID=UPI003A899C5B